MFGRVRNILANPVNRGAALEVRLKVFAEISWREVKPSVLFRFKLRRKCFSIIVVHQRKAARITDLPWSPNSACHKPPLAPEGE